MWDLRSTEPESASRWLRLSVAVVWLVAGALVLSPIYRAGAAGYLEAFGLPGAGVFVVCPLLIALALRTAWGPMATWLLVVQLGGLLICTVMLGALEPMLWVHPMGALTKNLPLAAALITSWLLEREGWSRRTFRCLRAGMAVIWITEGIFPKILFQQEMELAIARDSSFVFIDASLFLTLLGAAQALSGVLALTLRGRPLRALWFVQGAALIALPLLVAADDPGPWLHPLGPLVKTLPIAVGTLLLAIRGEGPRVPSVGRTPRADLGEGGA